MAPASAAIRALLARACGRAAFRRGARRSARRIVCLCAPVFAALCAAAIAFAAPPGETKPKSAGEKAHVITITPHANSTVTGKCFTIGDVAEIAGANPEMRRQLAAVEVGVSPLPGQDRLFHPGDIIVHLRVAHLDSSSIKVIGPPTMRVSRTGKDLKVSELAKTAISAAQDAIKGMPDAVLVPVSDMGRVTIPTEPVQFLAGAWRGDPQAGSVDVPVSIVGDGRVLETVDVKLRVSRKSAAFVTTRLVEPGETITADAVTLAPTDLPTGASPIADIHAIVGKRATRRMPANTVVQTGAVETPATMTANERITIEYIYGAIHITAPGIARQAGATGDTIRVFASDTQKDLDGIIVNEHTVRIVEAGDDLP
jgi:flagella basal body P-ring formation protein FlgA